MASYVRNMAILKELLGYGSYGTAWCWMQKLRPCTIREDRERLSGHETRSELQVFQNNYNLTLWKTLWLQTNIKTSSADHALICKKTCRN